MLKQLPRAPANINASKNMYIPIVMYPQDSNGLANSLYPNLGLISQSVRILRIITITETLKGQLIKQKQLLLENKIIEKCFFLELVMLDNFVFQILHSQFSSGRI